MAVASTEIPEGCVPKSRVVWFVLWPRDDQPTFDNKTQKNAFLQEIPMSATEFISPQDVCVRSSSEAASFSFGDAIISVDLRVLVVGALHFFGDVNLHVIIAVYLHVFPAV